MPKNGGATEGTPIAVGAVNQQDDSQLWQLVSSEGYLCQIVNKKSGLVIGTEKEILPTDGMVLVLNKYEQKPSYTNQWRVLRLKGKPGDESLTDALRFDPIIASGLINRTLSGTIFPKRFRLGSNADDLL